MTEEQAQLKELLSFLDNSNETVVKIALNNLVQYTKPSNPARSVFTNNSSCFNDFVRLSGHEDPTIAHDAYTALINLSAHSPGHLTKHLEYFVQQVLKPKFLLADLAAMVLSNLSKVPSVQSSLLTMKSQQDSSKKAMDDLIKVFVDGHDKNTNPNATYDFLSSVLADVSATSPGRDYLLGHSDGLSLEDASKTPICQISVFSEHPNLIRRGGVSSCIKNCCFEKENQYKLISETDYNLLPRILLPLCGPEEFDLDDQEKFPEDIQLLPPDKKREPDPAIRLIYVEALLLLCTTFDAREILREKNVYRVVQLLHKAETDENLREHIERLVHLIQTEESSETKANIEEEDLKPEGSATTTADEEVPVSPQQQEKNTNNNDDFGIEEV